MTPAQMRRGAAPAAGGRKRPAPHAAADAGAFGLVAVRLGRPVRQLDYRDSPVRRALSVLDPARVDLDPALVPVGALLAVELARHHLALLAVEEDARSRIRTQVVVPGRVIPL